MHGTHRYAVDKAFRAVPQIQISEFPNILSISHYPVSRSRFVSRSDKAHLSSHESSVAIHPRPSHGFKGHILYGNSFDL